MTIRQIAHPLLSLLDTPNPFILLGALTKKGQEGRLLTFGPSETYKLTYSLKYCSDQGKLPEMLLNHVLLEGLINSVETRTEIFSVMSPHI